MSEQLIKFKGACLYILCGTISVLPFHSVRILLLKCLKARIGAKTGLYRGFQIRAPWRLQIGSNSIIGHGALLDARMGLIIGNNVNLSNEVMIWTMHHDYNSPDFAQTGKRVMIDDYAWICSRAIILPGVHIGKGAVVAAGAVVTKNVTPFTVVGGIPAKLICLRNKNIAYSLADRILPII